MTLTLDLSLYATVRLTAADGGPVSETTDNVLIYKTVLVTCTRKPSYRKGKRATALVVWKLKIVIFAQCILIVDS